MSLDDLLKGDSPSPSWKNQRNKLTQIVVGLTVVLIAIVLIGIGLWRVSENTKIEDQKEQEAALVTELLKLEHETKNLQEEIKGIRTAASVPPRPKKTVPQRRVAQAAPAVPDYSDQIISFDPGEGFTVIEMSNEGLYIPTGAIFRARLITPIKTSVQRTFVIAETTHEFRMDMDRRIPKGSRLIGRSHLNTILKGVIVEFDTLVLPAGIETRISGLALSRNALPEIDGLYFSDDLQNYGAALAFGFLSGFTEAARTREPTIIGSQPEVTVSNQVLSGLSTASFQVAENILHDIRSRSVEYVVVPAGEPVFVALTQRYEINQRSARNEKE